MRTRSRPLLLGTVAVSIAATVLGAAMAAAPAAAAGSGASSSATATATASDVVVLHRGDTLQPGHVVRTPTVTHNSFTYYFTLVLTSAGNLLEKQVHVKTGNHTVYWQTGTVHMGAAKNLTLTSNGNLVLHNQDGTWKAGTPNLGVRKLVMKPNGNIVLETGTDKVKWASHTGICGKVKIEYGRMSSIVSAACRERGIMYCLGAGNQYGPTSGCGYANAFDCSGLSMYATYRGTGVVLDHYTVSQFNDPRGKHIAESDLAPGDLVYFAGAAGETRPGHVGVYIGNHYVVDAYDSGYPVEIHSFSVETAYWGARRFR